MRTRITTVGGQLGFVVSASIVIFLVGVGLAALTTSDMTARFIAGAAIIVVLACARLFQPTNSRPAWQLTESATSGWIWAALFAVSGVQVVAGIFEGLTGGAQRDVAIAYLAVAFAFANSSLAILRRARRNRTSVVS